MPIDAYCPGAILRIKEVLEDILSVLIAKKLINHFKLNFLGLSAECRDESKKSE